MRILDLFENAFLTDQPAFRRWFDGSKIVDAEGRPLKLYRGMRGHGLPDDHITTTDRMEPRKGYSMFFTTSPYVAASYANPDDLFGVSGAIFPVYVKADKLTEFPTKSIAGVGGYFDMFGFDNMASRLRAGEGLVVRQVVDIGPRADTSIDPEQRYSYRSDIYAFGRGTQIKSAVSNSGRYDPEGSMTD